MKITLLVWFFSFILFLPVSVIAQSNPNATVEAAVRGSFSDKPDMIKIAKCESGFRQFAPNGSVLRGSVSRYVGIFQIDENIHTKPALSLGFDIQTIEGNIGYADYLYSKSGTAPWKFCVSGQSSTNTPVITPVPTPPVSTTVPSGAISGALDSNLNFGMVSSQVRLLQQILNKLGFTIAETGPGSVGNETTRFGILTREAVRKFQCTKQIACEGDEYTTGYGRVGPKTRSVLNQLSQ